MDTKDFQKQILSQIRISDLTKALLSFENDRKRAIASENYILATSILDGPSDSEAELLMNKLLINASIPKELLDIIKHYTPIGKSISQATWEYFYNYSFTGKIITSFKVESSSLHPSAKPIFLIVAEDAIIDVFQAPLNMLLGFIEHICRDWKKSKLLSLSTYYLPKHSNELFIFIEAHVAKYYGASNPFDVGVISDVSYVFNGYRFVGIIDTYPFNNLFIDATKEACIRKANNTLN